MVDLSDYKQLCGRRLEFGEYCGQVISDGDGWIDPEQTIIVECPGCREINADWRSLMATEPMEAK